MKNTCAIARLADGLAIIIDGGGDAVGVAGDSWELLNLAFFPEDRLKLKDLGGAYAGWIRRIILSDPHHLASGC